MHQQPITLDELTIRIVKKIKLKPNQADNKIFREVNALSRLSHRYIVRYYTTWLEESEPTSSNASSDSGRGSDDYDEQTAGAFSNSQSNGTATPDSQSFGDPTSIDVNELVNNEDTPTSSFPSIHFTSGDVADDSSDEDTADSMQMVERRDRVYAAPMTIRTLYIQMVSSVFRRKVFR